MDGWRRWNGTRRILQTLVKKGKHKQNLSVLCVKYVVAIMCFRNVNVKYGYRAPFLIVIKCSWWDVLCVHLPETR